MAGLSALSVALLIAAAIVWTSRPGSRSPIVVSTHAKSQKFLEAPDETTGSIALPLTGTIQSSGRGVVAGGTSSSFSEAGVSASVPPTTVDTKGARSDSSDESGTNGLGSVDVPPGSAQTLDHLGTHVSSDGVMVSTFYTPNTTNEPGGTGNSCSPSGSVTLEVSDVQAVATFNEPFYGGFDSPLVDVQIGEFGVTEGKPASWLEAEVGPQVKDVEVRFADGSTDNDSPAGGIGVAAEVGSPETVFGNGKQASLEVLGTGGVVLSRYSIGFEHPETPPDSGVEPLPSPVVPPTVESRNAEQPTDPTLARKAVSHALVTALSCSEPPIVQSQVVTQGGEYESVGGATVSGSAPGDSVEIDSIRFQSAESAVVGYSVSSSGRQVATQSAHAMLDGTRWLVSLSSVAPGLQVAPSDQDGDVAIAPGGPLFTETGSGGVDVAVYRSLGSSTTGSDCSVESCTGSPEQACIPTGGLVEEVTTPGAVGIESGPLYGNIDDPIVSAGMSIIGEAEGAPATLIGLDVGSDVATVDLTIKGVMQSYKPADGAVEIVVNGSPSAAIGPSGGSVSVLDPSGQTLSSIPLSVDATEPAGASSLPSKFPITSTGTQPADPASAIASIDEVYETVFDCSNPPIVRSEDIQDDGMFANPLEQLLLGPYTELVESVYATVNGVTFESPTLADVSYTIRFHNDPTLTFSMVGTAVEVNGAWKVSYATLCAAVALGGVSCSS